VVHTAFTPGTNGTIAIDYTSNPITKANIVKPVASQQAAVTIGTGVSTQELIYALDKSGLFSFGAASGTDEIFE
jgi:hypothetical protein